MTAVASNPRVRTAGRATAPLRVLFALPGLHRVHRGAEVAFESVATELARLPGLDVTLIGSGAARADRPYRFATAACEPRERFERWPRFPVFRDHYSWEEATFAPRLWRAYDPAAYDVTVGCSYPFTNWVLRAKTAGRRRPPHVFVTQNGDGPARTSRREYRWFGCEGLVCTNPEFYERNRLKWHCVLIPNGVDPERFRPGVGDRAAINIPPGARVVLIVSALIPSKRVLEGVRAASLVPDIRLLVAGDGELRQEVETLGRRLLGDRFQRIAVEHDAMPGIYRCADVFLHMSQTEPSANAYIEALATGLPIVTHDCAITRWTFDGRATLLDTSDERRVADGLRVALGQADPAHARACRDLVESRYSWRSIASQYATFLSGVAGAR